MFLHQIEITEQTRWGGWKADAEEEKKGDQTDKMEDEDFTWKNIVNVHTTVPVNSISQFGQRKMIATFSPRTATRR